MPSPRLTPPAWPALHLPSACAVCGRWQADAVCADCTADFAPRGDRCPQCALPLPIGAALAHATCQHCAQSPLHWPLDACWAAVDYRYPWRDLVGEFKYHQHIGLARWMGERMAQSLRQPTPALSNETAQPLLPCDGVVPLPLTPQRLAERGYNQAQVLAQQWLHAMPSQPGGLPLNPRAAWWPDALIRLDNADEAIQGDEPDAADDDLTPARDDLWPTTHQSRRRRDERWRRMAGAFAVHPDRAHAIVGQRVLLIDDVMTTGATLHAAATALRQAGAAGVSALVFARAVPD